MGALRTIEFNGRQLIPTLGALTPHGKRIVGLFSEESDARSCEADKLAVAIVFEDDLDLWQQEVAERNSEDL